MRLVCSVGAFFEMGSESERVALGQLMSEQAQALRSWGHERWTAILERRKTTAVEIELAAPRLLLPEDLSRPLASVRMLEPGRNSVLPKLIRLDSAATADNLHLRPPNRFLLCPPLHGPQVLVLDIGGIRVSSAHVQPADADVRAEEVATALEAVGQRQQSVDGVGVSSEAHGVDPMAAALYDRFHVGVSAIQVLLATAKAEWRLPKVQQRLQLVYQFGLDLSLYTCILPPGGHPFEQLVVTAALAEGDAPSLSLRLSSPQLCALRAIVRAAGGAEGGGGSATPAATAAAAGSGSRARNKAQEHAHVAKDPAQEVKGAMLDIRGSFKLQHMMLMLIDETDDGERELVMLRTSDLTLDLERYTASQQLTFAVGSVCVEDRLQDAESPTYRLLDSGGRGATETWGGATAVSDDELARLRYRSGDKGAGSQLDFHFNTLHVEWNPATIAAVLAFLRSPSPASMQHVGAGNDTLDTPQAPVAPAASEEDPSSAGGELQVRARMKSLSVSLNEDSGSAQFALLRMQELRADSVLASDGGMRVSGQLGNLTAEDTFTLPHAPYEILGLRDASEGSLLTFEYDLPSEAKKALARTASEYDSHIVVRMSSVRLCYWHRAVMRTVNCLQEGVLGAITSAAASTVVQAAHAAFADEASAMSLNVEVGSPLVMLPTEAGCDDGLCADLGRIGVHNELQRRVESAARTAGSKEVEERAAVLLDCVRVRVEHMQMRPRLQDDAENHMLRDVAFEFRIERGLGSSAVRPTTVVGSAGELACACTKAQLQVMLSVVNHNLSGTGKESSQRPQEAGAVASAPGSDEGLRHAVPADPPPSYDVGPAISPLNSPDAGRDGAACHAVQLRVSLGLRGAELWLADDEGALVVASVCGVEASVHLFDSGDREVTFSCSAGRISSARADTATSGGGLPCLISVEPPTAARSCACGRASTHTFGTPQLQAAYSTKALDGRRTLVVNLHGAQVKLVPKVMHALIAFFPAADTPDDNTAPPTAPPTARRVAVAGAQQPSVQSPPAETTAERGVLGGHASRTRDAQHSSPATPSSVPEWAARSVVPAGPSRPHEDGPLVLLLSLESADVLLPRDPIGSDGIVLSGAFRIKFCEEHQHQTYALDLIGLQLRVGTFGTAAAILAPTDLSLTWNHTQFGDTLGSRTEATLKATQPLQLCISYEDCRLALQIAQQMQAAAPEPSPHVTTGLESGADAAPSPAATKTASATATVIEALAGAAVEDGGAPFAAVADAQTVQLSLSIEAERVRVVAINDCGGRAVPLMCFDFRQPRLVCSGTGRQLVMQTEVGISVTVFNPRLLAWEPLVEPWRCNLQVRGATQHDRHRCPAALSTLPNLRPTPSPDARRRRAISPRAIRRYRTSTCRRTRQ